MKKCFCLSLLCCLLCFLPGCSTEQEQAEPGKKTAAVNSAIEYWAKNNNYEPLLWEQADLDGDAELETVLIYRLSKSECGMVVISKTAKAYEISQSSRAPLENQMIKFQDIDQKLPLEIIISGSKQGSYGYGIFRLEKNQLIDLFAEGMEDCC